MKIGSLFSGIGGLELGLERAGLGKTVWQVEVEPKRRAVLAKHWPDVQRYEDIRSVDPGDLERVDIVCGGFPCKDVSAASRGRGKGMAGPRSSLWLYFLSVVDEVRPGVVVVENVFSGKNQWLPVVRHDLHGLGYRTSAFRIDARDVGAPHARARIFVVGYSHFHCKSIGPFDAEAPGVQEAAGLGGHWRAAFTGPLRVVDGVPGGVDRVRMLGDAVVPQCTELLGRVIKARL